jgi:hypothetical protein
VIDTNGDGTNVLTDTLTYQSGTEDFFIPAAREYPTANNQVLVYDSVGNDFQWEAQSAGSGLPVADTTVIVEGNLDDTKTLRLDVSGNATSAAGKLATTFTTNKTITFPDVADTVATENLLVTRDMFWQAGAISTDGTECSDPAEVTIASGPKQYAIACPMAGTETSGFLYGSTQLPSGTDIASDVLFAMTGYLTTDGGAGTWQGAVSIQCYSDGELVDATWGTAVSLDFTPVIGDVVNDITKTGNSAAVDLGADCVAGDTLFWRWEACDTDATPSAQCGTSSLGFEDDISVLQMRMRFMMTLDGL